MANSVWKAVIFIYLFISVLVGKSQAQTVISGQLSETVVESVFNRDGFYQLTADSRNVVYGGIFEGGDSGLFVVSVDGESARKLTDFGRDGRIFRFEISDDSQRVVFLSSEGLFSVDLAGGVPVRLDDPLLQPTNKFIISNDSSHVVFDNFGSIFSVPTNGGTIELLSDTNYSSEGDPFNYSISPDSKVVVFERLEFLSDGSSSLHILSTPISGGDLNELLPTNLGMQDSFGKIIDPTSTRLVYLSASNELQLFSVPILGGVRVQLSEAYSFNFDVRFDVSLDGQHIVYTADAADATVIDDSFIVPILGGESVKVNLGLNSGMQSCGTSFTPDSLGLVFCRGDSLERGVLFNINIDSPLLRTVLNNGQAVDGFFQNSRYTENGRGLLISSIVANTVSVDHGLIRLPIDGGAAQQLFQFESVNTSTPCFNGIDFSSNNTIFSYCSSVELDTRPSNLIVQRSDDQNGVQLEQGVTFHAITMDGANVIYLQGFDVGGTQEFRLVSVETAPAFVTPAQDEFCFPIVTGTSGAVICL